MAGKLFNIYSGNTGGVLSTSTAKVGSFGTTSDDFYSVNFDTGRKSIWTNNIEFGRAADWGNISGIPSWIGNDGVTWANVKDKPDTAKRWPYWSEILSKPSAIGSATQPVYWDGSTFQLANSLAPANHDHDNKYVKLDGTNVMSGDLTLSLADLDRFIVFSYSNAVNPSSNSWRTGVLGTGYGENNFFVVQYQRVNSDSSDWNTAFTIGQDTGTVTFTNNIKVGSYTVYHSGNLPTYPTVNNGALYLQANGTTKVTFTANQSSNLTFNIATGSANGTISVGGTDVAVKGLGSNAYSSTDYLPLAGGTMNDDAQIKRKGRGVPWIYGREGALIRETSSSGYHALFSLKTTDGSWELGEYNTSGWYNIPVFSYITDENYNIGNNSATYQIKYPLASGTIALTADLTWSKIADKPATATRWPSWDEVTSKPSVFPVASHNHDDRYPRKFSYTLPSQKGVRISYTQYATVLVSVCGSNSDAQLVIIGTGYGQGGRTRNQFTELVSCNLFDWSIPNSDSIACSVEIFSRRDSNSTVWVISTDNITFTEINALTSAKENVTLLNSSNYTSYTVKKDGTGATGTWGINISGNAATATKWQNARTLTIGNTGKTVDGTGNVSWSLSEIGAASSGHNHDDRYVNVSGDTMTGPLTFSKLIYNWTPSQAKGIICLKDAETFGIWYHEGEPDRMMFSASGNGSDYTTADLAINGAGSGTVTIRGNKIWHEGNDGSGSGLDADLLDGVHASGLFTNFSNKTISGSKVLAATIGGTELSVAVEYAGTSNTANYSSMLSMTRVDNINFNHYDSVLRGYLLNSSSTSNGAPGEQGWLLDFAWDWNGRYSSQIFIGLNGSGLKYRGDSGSNTTEGTYGSWKTVLDSSNYTTYTVTKTGGGASGTWGINITGNAATANSAGNADTLDTFHANGLFQTFTNDAATNAVKIQIGNTEKSLVVGYATKANNANSADGSEYLNYYSVSDPNTAYKDHVVKWFSQINYSSGYAGNNYGFPVGNNANGVLWLGTHSGNYGGQIGISSNGNIYYRYISAGNFSTAANGASWQVLLTSNNYTIITDARYVKKAGDTMTGLLTTTSGDSHDGIKVGNTYINAINGELILQNNSAIRFGGDSWDYNVWAGLKYIHSSKTIYLGLADGSSFTANSAQNGGKLYLPGIDNIYTGNGANLIWHSGNDGSGSGLNADLLDGKHAEDFIYRLRRSNNNVTGQPNNGMIPPAILEFLSAGYPVYTDPEFASGNNSCNVYNNQGNGTVTIERIADNQGSGNSSGYILKITTNGTASPDAGGFYQNIDSRANAIFMQVFRAKVPVGWNVYNAENAQGDNATITWLTDRAGTGKWEWYARLVYCGNTGSFHNGGHVYLSGTSNTSVTWYLSHITLVDITKGNYNGLRTRYADHATLSDSASSVAWANITGKATSKTAWGQTFVDSSGNIQSISGNMTSVGQVTPDGNAMRDNGTSSANWSSVYSYNLRSNDNLTLCSGTSKDIIFQTNAGTEYMRLTSNGKLGLGRVPTASDARFTMPPNSVAIDFRPDHPSYNAKIEYMTAGNEGLVFATKYLATSFIFMNGFDLTDRSDYSALGTAGLQIKSNAVAINRPIYGDNGMFYGDPGASGTKLVVGGLVKTISNGKYLVIGCQNSAWAHYETDASSGHYFNHGISVDGAIYIYGTNYGIRSSGEVHGNGFYHRSYLDNNYVLLSNGGAKQWSTSATANTIVARTGDNYIYAGYYNSAISNEDSMTPGSVYFAQSGENWIRKQSIETFADNLRSEEIISIDKSLTVTEAWMDTGIVCDTTTFPRGTGTYAVQVCAASMTEDSYYPYYSGIMTIYTSTTNSSGNDEVALHCAGHAVGDNYKRLYIRTQEQANHNYNKIQIAGSSNLSKAYTITFKFRKLI